MSSNSLGQRSQRTQKVTSQNKISFSRRRAETPAVSNTSPYPPSTSSPVRLRSPTDENFPSSSVKVVPSSSLRPNSSDILEFSALAHGPVHPYANPDLVVSNSDEVASDTTAHANLNYRFHNDVKSFSMDSMVKPSGRLTLIPDSSISSTMISVAPKVRTISTKNISSPVPVIGAPQPLGAEQTIDTKLPGWTGQSVAPFKLISLEEARAQKMRHSTDTGATTLSLSDSMASFPATINSRPSSSPLTNLTSRARGRSVSASSKAKNAIHNIVGQPKLERRESERLLLEDPVPGLPPGKTLKNKKSVIMRLFNKEKEAYESPPPVPSVPEGIAQRESGHVAHRVPLSTSSPSHSESADNQNKTEGLSPRKLVKRMPPSLPSIDTAPQGPIARTLTPYQATAQDRLHIDYIPQSAPPEFPILKLRPVSTLFSASFGDLVPTETRSSDETTDQETPRSPSPTTLMSPITPVSRQSNEQCHTGSSEHLSKVKVLQDEVISAKKARQRHIWDLEGQVRDLKAELEELKRKNDGEYCDKCGRGGMLQPRLLTGGVKNSRARTGTSSRFVNPQLLEN